MPSASPSQKLDEISKELDILRAQSLSHPEKAAEILQDGLGQIQVSLKELTALVDGMTGAERSEETLRESEKQLKYIIENSMDVAYRRDLRTDRFDYISPSIENITGFSVGEMMAMSAGDIVDRVHPDDLDIVYKKFEMTLRGGYCVIEYRFMGKDGNYRWIADSTNVLADSHGNPIYRIGVVRDITERKRAEESEERLRALMDHNPSLVFLKDESGKYVYLNKAYERQFALSKDWYGKTDFDFWPKESAELFRMNDSDVSKSGQTHQFLEDSTDLEGIRHCWLCYKFPFVDSKNKRYVGGIGIDATDRIRAEEALRLAYARLQTFFDHRIGGIGILIANAKGSILQANDYYLSILGCTREELLSGQVDWRKMTPQEWLPADERALAQLKERGVCDTYEKEYLRRDETRVTVLITDAMMPGDSGDILAFVLDITERKKVEEMLQESEERYRRVVQNTTAIILRIDPQGIIRFANERALEFFGYSLEELIGRHAVGTIVPEQEITGRDLVAMVDEIALNPDSFHSNANENICKDGRRVWMEWTNSGIYDGDGKLKEFLSVGIDATDRKQAEKALTEAVRLAENRALELKAIIDAIPDGLTIYDKDGKPTYLNDVSRKILASYQIEDAPPLSNRTENAQVCMPDGKTITLADTPLYRALMTGKVVKDFVVMSQKGQVYTSLSCAPIWNSDGEITGAVATHKDISDQRMAEKELRRSKEELELRVLERTAELSDAKEILEVINEELQMEISEHEKTEKELLKAKEAAEEAVKVKAAFMANMSHELRTPMNSVIGFTGLLLEDPLTVEQKDYLESIRNSGEALMTLINEVLDFSKMDREKMDLEIQTFDLRNITEEALDVVAAQATNKGLELNYTFSKNVPEAIIGDPGKLRQVLSNLLSNAVKFTQKGEIEVNVSSDIDQDEIHFVVRDTGIGIREEDIEKLFQPFSQLDLCYSRGFEGTGLGLAISKKLVELMGGRIWIESEEGIGSTFHFTIPAETAPAKHKPFLTGGFEGKQVLIAAENQTLRRILGRQLHAWSIVPMMASNIYEAIELLQRDNGFDAVIIDASRDDVVSLITEKRDRWKQLPFIALTALGQKVPQNIFQAVLPKSLKPAKLFNALKNVLEEREVSEPTEVPEMEKSYGPLRILLAEDNLSNQKVTSEMLKKLGYRADSVVNGLEVLEALERQPYDIIFMDVKMPLMNGIQAARKIRERWPENGPRIIAVTAYALHGDKEKCLAAGMDDYIPKPVQKEDLAKVLGKYSIGA